MDIALLSMALSQRKVQQQASVSVMKKAIGNAELQSEALQKLMSTTDAGAIEHTAQPHLGSSIDLKL